MKTFLLITSQRFTFTIDWKSFQCNVSTLHLEYTTTWPRKSRQTKIVYPRIVEETISTKLYHHLSKCLDTNGPRRSILSELFNTIELFIHFINSLIDWLCFCWYRSIYSTERIFLVKHFQSFNRLIIPCGS